MILKRNNEGSGARWKSKKVKVSLFIQGSKAEIRVVYYKDKEEYMR